MEEGYTQFSVPQVITYAWLMDIGSRDTYWDNYEANCEAEAAASAASMSGRVMPMDDDDSDPRSFTNLLQVFTVTGIQRTNTGTVITFQSCQMFRYLVFYANSLSNNESWIPLAYVWGQTNASSTTWTDMATTNDDGSTITQRFYRVQRLLGNVVAAGGYHSLAIPTNGALWAWGGDDQGQLADGATTNEVFPIDIEDAFCSGVYISNLVTVAAGYDYGAAADANGVPWTWGQDNYGQLANGIDGTTQVLPSPISGVSNIVSVAAGYQHTLFLRADGTVWAAGSDAEKQLGDGGLAYNNACYCTNSPIRSLVPTGTVIVAVAAGSYHSLALDESGNVWVWGDNGVNELGLGSGAPSSTNVPTMLTSISNVIAIAAGSAHSVALTADGRIWTWGSNINGELGGTTNGGSSPGLVTALTNQPVVAIAGGNEFTLVATSNGYVYAWGYNDDGSANRDGALGTNGIVSSSSPILVPGISNVVTVSAHPTGYHGLAMALNHGTNDMYGWGENGHGQVGNGTTTTPVDPPAGPLQFCDPDIQLGTGGVFTATCTGTLLLFFNDQVGDFDDDSGAYTALVCGVTLPCTQVVVAATVSNGVAVGTVSNGVTYSYNASGLCTYCSDNFGRSCTEDASGVNTQTEQLVGCPPSCSLTIPGLQCFSLVGKIEQQ